MPNKKALALLISGILFIALNLRGPITSAGSILSFISDNLQLSSTQAGLITTLPLLVFAALSPMLSSMAKRFGLEVLIMFAMILLTAGIIIRSSGEVSTLFAGTLFIGTAIATCNVLLPALLKRDLPQHLATMTAMYVLFMGMGSTISASIAVPILEFSHSLQLTVLPDWAFSLLSSALLSLIAIVL